MEPTTSQIHLIETLVLAELSQLKQGMIAQKQQLKRISHQTTAASKHYDHLLLQLAYKHRQQKQQRRQARVHAQKTLSGKVLATCLAALEKESQLNGIEKRRLKQKRNLDLLPLTQAIAHSNQQIAHLKQQYQALSTAWQAKMQQTYFAALVQANPSATDLPIVYQDDDLIAIDKPAGLLSVPGRRYAQQDSVVSRLRYQRLRRSSNCSANYPLGHSFLQTVHRLDQATSGLLLIALSKRTHQQLSEQFAQQQIRKAYEAILTNPIDKSAGLISLPLRADTEHRPRQRVDSQHGKESRTAFEVIVPGEQPRVRLVPQTGRTHQLRVHVAYGLGAPILGDELYGFGFTQQGKERLHLHASELEFLHPASGEQIQLHSPTPF